MNNLKIYIASGLRNADKVNRLSSSLKAHGHTITYEWANHGSVQGEGHTRMVEVAKAEMQGVRDADVVVVLLPGLRGTHVELGAAIALDKPVLLLGDGFARRVGGVECAFHYSPNVTPLRSSTLRDVLDWLEGQA